MNHPVYQGQVRISHRPETADSKEVIRFTITESESRSQFVQFDIEPKNLMLALTNRLPEQPIGMVFTNVDRIGKRMQTKNVLIDVQHRLREFSDKECIEMATPHEQDGWKARLSDFNNGQRRVRDGVMSITFYRWVDPNNKSLASDA